MVGLIFCQHILNDEVDPLGDIDLEEQVIPDQLVDDLINDIVELPEFAPGVGVVVEDVTRRSLTFWHFDVLILEIFLHVEEKLEEELADSQIFADHLPLVNGFDVLQVRLLLRAVLEEIFDLFDLFSDLHQPSVFDVGLRILPTPFEVLSQIDDLSMERKSKQTLFFEGILDLFDHEAVFGYLDGEFDLLDLVLHLVDC